MRLGIELRDLGDAIVAMAGPPCALLVVVCLVIGGKRLNSEQFAELVQTTFDRQASTITFVIGGSLGLSPAVLERADYRLSVSDMTLPHGLCRVVLMEQVYRAFKINAHEPYHK